MSSSQWRGGRADAQLVKVPIELAAILIDQEMLQKQALEELNFFRNWRGATNLVATAILATQHTFNSSGGSVSCGSLFGVNYLPERNPTIANYYSS